MPLVDTISPPKGYLWLSVLGYWCPTTCADIFQEVKLSLSRSGRGETHVRTWHIKHDELFLSAFQCIDLELGCLFTKR